MEHGNLLRSCRCKDRHIDNSIRPELERVSALVGAPLRKVIAFYLNSEKGCLGDQRVGIMLVPPSCDLGLAGFSVEHKVRICSDRLDSTLDSRTAGTLGNHHTVVLYKTPH